MIFSAKKREQFLELFAVGKEYTFSEISELVQEYNKTVQKTLTLSFFLLDLLVQQGYLRESWTSCDICTSVTCPNSEVKYKKVGISKTNTSQQNIFKPALA